MTLLAFLLAKSAIKIEKSMSRTTLCSIVICTSEFNLVCSIDLVFNLEMTFLIGCGGPGQLPLFPMG